jgi:hypothetical protein
MGLPEVPVVVHTVLSILWILVLAFLAFAAFAAFRTTASGILLGGGSALAALQSVTRLLLYTLVLKSLHYDDPRQIWVNVASLSLTALLGLVTVVGVALIPTSMRRLAR